MIFFPRFELGWLNGWLYLCVFYLVFGIIILSSPMEVRARLYSTSNLPKKSRFYSISTNILGFFFLLQTIFTPLKTDSIEFILGSLMIIVSIICMSISLINYKNTPLDVPVTKGIYEISRNPQIIMILLTWFGISFSMGSWVAIITVISIAFFFHFKILDEEKACLKQYGKKYQDYIEKVSRYFFFF
ncbi:isoprenylcysteine carboxylmethyltransferase family protein [Promethearchaeum syntrophicum]|uniref:Isoprenylcysteine carboxylmethyltransferase family protein n=1 Tax=Promethearchaeum syntrophicum TaxID=2594042 RepID=A0A5B9D9H5_9ARCH|nr:methyltransferase [Candidatus Prometheoarchaeum syntrophicum]QEE15661.1 hypothetical protein DSAG12_01488 [Candidatus Prometheoarchaeum syntrophicum]